MVRTALWTSLLVLGLSLAVGASDINTLNYVAKDYSFEGPTSTTSGYADIRLDNQGQDIHHLQLVRLSEGMTPADLQAYLAANPEGALPVWAREVGGPSVVAPGMESNATVYLTPGTYMVLCVIPDANGVPHMAHGMVSVLEVTGPEIAFDVDVRLSEYGFRLPEELSAGSTTFRVVNLGDQPHEIFLVQLMPGATVEQVIQALAGQAEGPPPGLPFGGLQGIAPGESGYFTADLAPGNYAALCFIPDAGDGMPHVLHGMVQEFVVK